MSPNRYLSNDTPDDLATKLSGLDIYGRKQLTVDLIKGIRISNRHRDDKRNFCQNIKSACYKALSPYLRKIGDDTSIDSFDVSAGGDVILILSNRNIDIEKESFRDEIEYAMEITGLNDWARGDSGWRFSKIFASRKEQKSTLDALNKLQDVFKTCAVLFKMDILRFIYGKKEILRKSDDICDMNHDLRNLCEIIIAIDKDKNDHPSTSHPGILQTSHAFQKSDVEGMTVEKRWKRIMKSVYGLMRTSSKSGPSAPLQWAAHPPKNHYPLTVITKESQEEVIYNVTCIIRNLFWGKAEDSKYGVGGVGDVWFNSKKRRASDWEGNNDDCLDNFKSPEILRKSLNKEY